MAKLSARGSIERTMREQNRIKLSIIEAFSNSECKQAKSATEVFQDPSVRELIAEYCRLSNEVLEYTKEYTSTVFDVAGKLEEEMRHQELIRVMTNSKRLGVSVTLNEEDITMKEYLINNSEVQLIREVLKNKTIYTTIICGEVIYQGDSYDIAYSYASMY